MAILRQIFTITNSSMTKTILHTYSRICLHTWPAEMCWSGPWSAEYLGSAEKLRIFRRRYIVGILTNKLKANISIKYYLVPYRLSTDSKTRDLEWPFCVKCCFVPVCLELCSEAWLSKHGYAWTCSECCRRTLNRKEQLRHRAVFLQQHCFLVKLALKEANIRNRLTVGTTTLCWYRSALCSKG